MTKPTRITRIQGFALRKPIENPVMTSFGIMQDRPAVFLRIEDEDGAFGWGEIFANWPAAAAEHRINLLARDIGPLVLSQPFSAPEHLFHSLTQRTHTVALQSGEWGPFRQVIAGLDIALWDLFARKAGQTVRHFMNEAAPSHVPAYASGIHIGNADKLIEHSRSMGIANFKVKIGFDMANDLERLQRQFDRKQDHETLAADANQAWDTSTALEFLQKTAHLPLAWLEEPLGADVGDEPWGIVHKASPHPLAGGENIVEFAGFDHAINAAHLSIFQPDVVKWGGLSGCLTVARQVRAAGLRYCPHFLGGGIGLQASANLLAAVGGDGLLEIDVNPNPLRDAFGSISDCFDDNGWRCNGEPGLGIISLPEEFETLMTHEIEISAGDI